MPYTSVNRLLKMEHCYGAQSDDSLVNKVITGQPTHSVGGPDRDALWRLLLPVVVSNTLTLHSGAYKTYTMAGPAVLCP